MVDIPFDFITPETPNAQVVPGILNVYDWTKCRILIDKQVFTPLSNMDCTRSADLGAGIMTAKFLDPDKTIYDSITPGMEIEIYLSEASPLRYANKVWGGFVDSREFDVTNKVYLIVKGKEYLNNLILNMTNPTVEAGKNSFTDEEPGTAIKALMTNYQVDFTSDGVLDGTSSLITADFLNMTLFDSIKKICDKFGYVFYVNNDKDLIVRKSTTQIDTPLTDYLTYGDNLYSIKEQENKELLTNDIIVYGNTSGVVSNSGDPLQDETSVTTYGVNAKRIVVSSYTTSDDCTAFAQAYLSAYKNPLKEYKTESRLIAYSDPLMYIPLISGLSSVNGSYKIRQIQHFFDGKGIHTEMTLSSKISDLSITLGDLLQRVQSLEITTYV